MPVSIEPAVERPGAGRGVVAEDPGGAAVDLDDPVLAVERAVPPLAGEVLGAAAALDRAPAVVEPHPHRLARVARDLEALGLRQEEARARRRQVVLPRLLH